MRKNNFFFILSVGRCGSLWLARLLNRAENARVVHEIDVSDRGAFLRAYVNEEDAFAYFRNKRVRIINERAKKAFIYGEVNGVLRYHIRAIRAYYPQADLFRLVRNGRDVVRSWLSRDTLNGKDDLSRIIPRKDDSIRSEWKSLSRFSRVCWLFASESRFLRKNQLPPIQFERLISDYDYFRTELLSRIGISISPDVWNEARRIKANSTSRYRIPHYLEWNDYQKAIFDTFCHEENKANGYD